MLMNILCSVLLCVHRNNIYMLSWSAQIVTRSVFEARACGNDLFPYTCVITNTGCCEHRLTHHQPKYKTEIEARACGNDLFPYTCVNGEMDESCFSADETAFVTKAEN